MNGTICSINISPGGLPKLAIAEASVTPLGLAGDSWAHPRIHGGPRKAVLLLTLESIDELRALGFALYPGALGENLTVEGLDRRLLRPGQRYRAGAALIELTGLREPCAALDVYGKGLRRAVFSPAVQRGDTHAPAWGLSGFYARVVEPGPVRLRDTITLVDHAV